MTKDSAQKHKLDQMVNDFVHPNTQKSLVFADDCYKDGEGNIVAKVIRGVPRFVGSGENYAENFGFEWNHWENILSDNRNEKKPHHKYNLLMKRTAFDKLDMEGKTILECGCGGGDDTEVLLDLPFKKVYSFDLSGAVDRVRKFNKGNDKLVLFQASIMEIPFRDESFDYVFCHRVLQHTPDPFLSLQHIMSKVKPGGILFVHSYHRVKEYMRNYKYKYRFITKRLPEKWMLNYVNWFAFPFYYLNKILHRTKFTRKWAKRIIPFEHYEYFANFDREQLIELNKLVTFDALTPMYDIPMTWKEMSDAVEKANFEILHSQKAPKGSPIFLTARKKEQ